MMRLELECYAICETFLMQNEARSIFQPEQSALKMNFLVFTGSSIMCVASAIDPLRAANRILGSRVFDFRLVSVDGTAPITTCGLPIAVEGAFDPKDAGDVVVAIGGFGSRNENSRELFASLRQAARKARAIGGIEAGTWLLGYAGLLDGRAATTHWEDMEDFSMAFRQAQIIPDRYVIDGPIFTAGGASPGFDLMLHLIRSRFGMALALDVASVFIYDQTRSPTDAQPLVTLGRLREFDPRLTQAIRLMENRIDAPLPTSAIAKRTGVSTRTLEKIFMQAIGETPAAYSLRLRLNAARRLVLDTVEPIAEIATRTGFSSAAGFSRAFAKAFDQPPSHMRRR